MALVADLLDLFSAGRLDPVRPATYPLEHVAAALDDLLARRTVGKVALIP
jgi:NADPH2:quinone reductase